MSQGCHAPHVLSLFSGHPTPTPFNAGLLWYWLPALLRVLWQSERQRLDYPIEDGQHIPFIISDADPVVQPDAVEHGITFRDELEFSVDHAHALRVTFPVAHANVLPVVWQCFASHQSYLGRPHAAL